MIASQVDISKALKIGGWMSEKELTWLAETAQNKLRIVEFGSYHGRSTRALADNSPNSAKIWSVDPWNGIYLTDDGKQLVDIDTYCLPQFKKNLRDHIDSGKVIPIRNYSYNFEAPEIMDFVFIDGDHREEVILKDINKALSIIGNKGTIAGHDYGHPLWFAVKKIVDNIFKKVEVVDSIWIVNF